MQLNILRAESRLAYYKLFILPSDISRSSVMMIDSALSYSSNQSRCASKVSDPRVLEGSKMKKHNGILVATDLTSSFKDSSPVYVN